MQKSTKKKIFPIIITILLVLYILPAVGMFVYVAGMATSEGFGEVVPILLPFLLIGGAVIVGIICAMAQRLREIDGGEEDEASKY